jgi:hypothetical protein
MKNSLRQIRYLVATNRTAGSRSRRYYYAVIAPSGGHPTCDEARRDLRERDRATTMPPLHY